MGGGRQDFGVTGRAGSRLKRSITVLSLKVHLNLDVQVHVRPVSRVCILVERTFCPEKLIIRE